MPVGEHGLDDRVSASKLMDLRPFNPLMIKIQPPTMMKDLRPTNPLTIAIQRPTMMEARED